MNFKDLIKLNEETNDQKKEKIKELQNQYTLLKAKYKKTNNPKYKAEALRASKEIEMLTQEIMRGGNKEEPKVIKKEENITPKKQEPKKEVPVEDKKGEKEVKSGLSELTKIKSDLLKKLRNASLDTERKELSNKIKEINKEIQVFKHMNPEEEDIKDEVKVSDISKDRLNVNLMEIVMTAHKVYDLLNKKFDKDGNEIDEGDDETEGKPFNYLIKAYWDENSNEELKTNAKKYIKGALSYIVAMINTYNSKMNSETSSSVALPRIYSIIDKASEGGVDISKDIKQMMKDFFGTENPNDFSIKKMKPMVGKNQTISKVANTKTDDELDNISKELKASEEKFAEMKKTVEGIEDINKLSEIAKQTLVAAKELENSPSGHTESLNLLNSDLFKKKYNALTDEDKKNLEKNNPEKHPENYDEFKKLVATKLLLTSSQMDKIFIPFFNSGETLEEYISNLKNSSDNMKTDNELVKKMTSKLKTMFTSNTSIAKDKETLIKILDILRKNYQGAVDEFQAVSLAKGAALSKKAKKDGNETMDDILNSLPKSLMDDADKMKISSTDIMKAIKGQKYAEDNKEDTSEIPNKFLDKEDDSDGTKALKRLLRIKYREQQNESFKGRIKQLING